MSRDGPSEADYHISGSLMQSRGPVSGNRVKKVHLPQKNVKNVNLTPNSGREPGHTGRLGKGPRGLQKVLEGC